MCGGCGESRMAFLSGIAGEASCASYLRMPACARHVIRLCIAIPGRPDDVGATPDYADCGS
jgi:hypothetical protein